MRRLITTRSLSWMMTILFVGGISLAMPSGMILCNGLISRRPAGLLITTHGNYFFSYSLLLLCGLFGFSLIAIACWMNELPAQWALRRFGENTETQLVTDEAELMQIVGRFVETHPDRVITHIQFKRTIGQSVEIEPSCKVIIISQLKERSIEDFGSFVINEMSTTLRLIRSYLAATLKAS